ncbi:MAG: NifU family protein [Bacilli bacterium]
MENNQDNQYSKGSIEEKIDVVLDKLRPFLAREGGNIVLDHFDELTGICYVDMIGACAGCILAASDVSDSVEVMLMDEVPEITKVELIAPKENPEAGYQDLLKRLAEEQSATQELDKINAARKAVENNKNTDDK